MADPIIQQGVQKAFTQVETAQPTNVSMDAKEQFQNAMDAGKQTPSGTENVAQPVNEAQGVDPSKKTAGDNILDSMQRNVNETKNALESSVNSMNGELGDMFRVQYQIAQVTMTQTVVGQVGSKTGQGTQQLLKGQG